VEDAWEMARKLTCRTFIARTALATTAALGVHAAGKRSIGGT
jgi:hypothetical protein